MTSIRSIQAPGAVVMVRPHAFTLNPQTAADNAFERSEAQDSAETQIVPLSVPTIELACGSVRCMLAGIHLSPRTDSLA